MTKTSFRLLWLAVLLSAFGRSTLRARVTVEEVGPGAAREAGLIPGDVILSWRREELSGSFESPLDVLRVETEEAPLGPVAIRVETQAGSGEITLPPGRWRLATTLGYDEATRRILERASTSKPGALALRDLATRKAEGGERDEAVWLLLVGADQQEDWATASQLFTDAGALAASDPRTTAWVFELAGESARRRHLSEEAEQLHDEGLRLRHDSTGESLVTARSLDLLARVAWARRDLTTAEARLGRVLAIRQRLAPRSLDTAATLNNLGILRQRLGDLASAEEVHRQSLAIKELVQPDGMGVAASLGNLSVVLDLRGDLAGAEELDRRALEIEERLAPESEPVAQRLNNLAVLARSRGDLLLADELVQRSLSIKEKLDPGGMGVAASLNNLGAIALAREDLDAAEPYFRRALAIKERLAPTSAAVAETLTDLGAVYRIRGDLDHAVAQYRKALSVLEETAPDGLAMAAALTGLAEVTLAQGELPAAEALHRRALRLRERLAPGSAELATSHFELGRVVRDQGRRREALEHFEAAMTALELQGERLGGPRESLATFRAGFADLYRETIDLLLELDRPEDAFHVLERSRARGLLAMMATRDLVVASAPAELEMRRREIDAEQSRTLAELATAPSAADPGQEVALRERLEELRGQQAEIRARIRAVAPRTAALRYPQPLDLGRAREVLQEGTLALAYSLRADHSLLFLLGPADDDFAVLHLAVGETELREEVEVLRSTIQRGSGRSSSARARVASRRLTEALLAPAAEKIEAARRLLLVPEGVLHRLPFSALSDPRDPDRYLVESKPLASVASLTVFAELEAARRKGAEKRTVAFGDPDYPRASSADQERAVTALRRFGSTLQPLPASRDEVLAVGRIFGEEASVWLGSEATEERLLGLGEDVRILHLAVHGFLDDRSPMESVLAMAPPPATTREGPNGLVQAWEIIEQLRLDADLVTLSACETGLGREAAGEGVLGMTRAFQLAGARNVLASLWRVDDESTSELMQRFYRHLHRGLPAAEALRAAQLELIRDPATLPDGHRLDASHPFHWAAFQLVGDGR